MAKKVYRCNDCKGKLAPALNGAFLCCEVCKRVHLGVGKAKGGVLLYPRMPCPDFGKRQLESHELEPLYLVGSKVLSLSAVLRLAEKAPAEETDDA